MPNDPDATRLHVPTTPAVAGDECAPPGYEILSELGRGGMGVVYLARQASLGRIVALKMILAGRHASAEELARFQTEAEALGRLQHPGIVQVFEVGEHEGRPYFSLEYCAGGSLEKRLNGTPLPAGHAAALVERLAGAIEAAHQARVIHRDLKPGNVLLQKGSTPEPTEAAKKENGEQAEPGSRRAGKPPLAGPGSSSRSLSSAASVCSGVDLFPKITDFGLARKLDDVSQTVSGVVMGTPSYTAPEQAQGRIDQVGPACDVYALGAILYECLTGRPPFRAATTFDTILQVISEEPVPPSRLNAGVPRDLETIALKCLHKEPARRYVRARELADDLGRFLRDEPIHARPVGPLERAGKWMRRNRTVTGLAVAVLLALAGGTVLSTLFAIEARTQTREVEAQQRQTRRALEEVESTLLDSLLLPIGQRSSDLEEIEREALTRLGSLSDDRIRLRFLDRGLRQPRVALRLGLRAEFVAQAVVGISPARREGARERLVHLFDEPTTSPEARQACVLLGAALQISDGDFTRKAADVLITALCDTTDPKQIDSLVATLKTLSRHLEARRADTAGRSLLVAMRATTNPDILLGLTKGLIVLCERMRPAVADSHANEAAARLVAVIPDTRTSSGLQDLARGLTSLAPRLGSTLAGKATLALDEASSRPIDTSAQFELAQTLSLVCGRLPPERIAPVASSAGRRLLRHMKAVSEVLSLETSSAMLAVLMQRMTPEEASRQAGEAVGIIVSGFLATRDEYTLSRHLDWMKDVVIRIDSATAGKNAETLLAALERALSTDSIHNILDMLVTLCPRLDAKQARSVADRIASVCARTKNAHDLSTLASRLEGILVGVPANEAREPAAKLGDALVAALHVTRDVEQIAWLVRAFHDVSPRLDARRAAEASDALLAAMDRTVSPTTLEELVKGLNRVLEPLGREQVATFQGRAADAIVRVMGKTRDGRLVGSVAALLDRVVERLPPGQAGPAAEAVVAAMEKSTDGPGLARLAQTVGLLAARLEREKASRMQGRAIRVLKETLKRTSDVGTLVLLTEALRKVSPPGDVGVEEQTDRTNQVLLAALERTTNRIGMIVLLRNLESVGARLHAEQVRQVARTLVGAMARIPDPHVRNRLAFALLGLTRRLPADEAARHGRVAARLLLVDLDGARRNEEFGGLVILFEQLGPFLDRQQTAETAEALVRTIARTTIPVSRKGLGRTLSALGERLPTSDLVALLRHPLAIEPARRPILDVLGRRSRTPFQTCWEYVEHAQGGGLEPGVP